MSRRSRVSGSCIGTMPVSSSTVAMHMVLEPDMGGYSVGSMMMAPATQSGRVGGTIRLTCRATRAARLADQQAADVVEVALEGQLLLEHGGAGRRQHAADDDIADLALGMAADHTDRAGRAHRLLLAQGWAGNVARMQLLHTRINHRPETDSRNGPPR